MVYNNIELESTEPITEYTPEPSWTEVFKAQMQSQEAVGLSSSENNYYNDEMKVNHTEWVKNDPVNKGTYDQIINASYQNIDRLENYYTEGNIDKIKSFYALPGEDSLLGTAFLKYKELGHKPLTQIREDARNNSRRDYNESQKLLQESTSPTAIAAGSMAALFKDPVFLTTLPLGTWKTGASVLGTAGRAAIEEMGIETMFQLASRPQIMSYKKELGIKTTLTQEAYQAVTEITGAGLFRAAGSATFDLTAKGIKQLKIKDPELAIEYENLTKSNISESVDDHIDNLDSIEFGNGQIKNLSEEGKLKQQEPDIPEVPEETIELANHFEVVPEVKRSVYSGTDAEGNSIRTTYEDMKLELDAEEEALNKAFNTGSDPKLDVEIGEATGILKENSEAVKALDKARKEKVNADPDSPEYDKIEEAYELAKQKVKDVQARYKKQKKEKDTGSDEYGKQINDFEESLPKKQGFQSKLMEVDGAIINKTDYDLIQSYIKKSEWNRNNTNKKTITAAEEKAYRENPELSDNLKDIDFKENVTDAQMIFSKFGDNIAAGTVAGIEEDENGNITFNPEMFVAGLGGYTAAKAMFKAGAFKDLPEAVNSQVKKYFRIAAQQEGAK